MAEFIVAVHGGAGFHDPSSEKVLKHALRLACSNSLVALKAGESSVQAVEDAIIVMENEECLNAGYGSNLTMEGTVECDASLMDGTTMNFGGVGAVSGVKNPISLAHSVMRNASEPHPLGLVPPMILVGQGALALAQTSDIGLISPRDQVSPRAKKEWRTWTQRLNKNDPSSAHTQNAHITPNYHDKQDTVGAVSCDLRGNMAAGVSSGGLLLKHPGRLGEATVFGAGCWANSPSDCDSGTACSISGTGEQIIRTSLAQRLAEALEMAPEDDVPDVLQSLLTEKFCRPCKVRGDVEPNAGILLLTKYHDEDGKRMCRLWCAFTTGSMAVAYASSLDEKPKAVILRRPPLDDLRAGLGFPLYVTTLPLSR